MTVADIKEKVPEADVYELRPDMNYLIVGDCSYVNKQQMKDLGDYLGDLGAKIIVMTVDDPKQAIKLLESSESIPLRLG